ncbi:hypothetical protein SLEP1_g5047 [Rubroshorea leprosula]|uniref:Uncharacterized protein n=1 Tax=Rubroshorea leprosula TaxID=152421 RepID=A0AAV5I0J1_9ROSI|nr:hypothetical protein SLEP1_g5047 [Rubroshorea leprosula]
MDKLLASLDHTGMKAKLYDDLDVNRIINRNVGVYLVESFRFSIAYASVRVAGTYLFDEPLIKGTGRAWTCNTRIFCKIRNQYLLGWSKKSNFARSLPGSWREVLENLIPFHDAGLVKPNTVEGSDVEIPQFNVSLKSQNAVHKFQPVVWKIMRSKFGDSCMNPNLQSTARNLLHSETLDSCMDPQFVSYAMEPLLIEPLLDQEVVNLSEGELHYVCVWERYVSYFKENLYKPADVYLIDEPSAYLDSKQRIVASKVIRRFILYKKKTAFVVEHDLVVATYLADRVIVHNGQSSVNCTANTPHSPLTGMNLFLSVSLAVVFSPEMFYSLLRLQM